MSIVAFDPFAGSPLKNTAAVSASADHWALVTPSDTDDLPFVCRQILVGTGGAVKVTSAGGETGVIPSQVVAIAPVISIRLSRIWATGTTASNIMVLW